MSFREAIEIIKDTEKGAAQLAMDAVNSVLELSTQDEVDDYLMKLVKCRPSMAPLLNLANHVFIAGESRHDIWDAAEDFKKKLLHNREKASETMFGLIEDKHVLTLSYSSTVKMSLKDLPLVSIMESRPLMEGRSLAQDLASAGTEVCY